MADMPVIISQVLGRMMDFLRCSSCSVHGLNWAASAGRPFTLTWVFIHPAQQVQLPAGRLLDRVDPILEVET